MAKKNGRRYIGIEISQEYVDEINRRIGIRRFTD
jgi:DNA modification methylase